MSATTSTIRARTANEHGVTALGVLRSEWLKLVTVRSTFWTTLVALLLAAGIAALAGGFLDSDRAQAGADAGRSLAIAGSTASLSFVALVVGVLGVLSIGGEYATLQIRSSYTAVPQRWPALVAKAIVVGAWSFVLGLIVTFGSYAIVAAFLGSKDVDVSLNGDVVGALVGGASYLAIIAVLAVGLGTLVRASAAGITILTAVLFVAPIILNLLAALTGADWATTVGNYFPASAGGVLFARPGTADIELWAALIALACWLAAIWTPAIFLTKARDV